MTRLLRRFWFFLAAVVICLAIISSLFRALTPWARQYKSEVEQHLSTLLGQSVNIRSMETSWYWFEPVIKLQDITVSSSNGNEIRLNRLLVGIDLFQSLWHWQIQPGILYVDGINLTLRHDNNQWHIDGIKRAPDVDSSYDSTSWSALSAWILAQQKILIRNVSGKVYWQDGSLLPLKRLDLAVLRQSGRYRIKGRAFLDQKPATTFRLLADMALDPSALNKAGGDIYVAVRHARITQWQHFFPQNRFEFSDGKTDIQLWLSVLNGQVQSAQSQLAVQKAVWQDSISGLSMSLPWFRGNLDWMAQNNGWKLTADHIKLKLGNFKWPENRLQIEYQQVPQRYNIYVEHVLLDSLYSIRHVFSPWLTDDQQIRLSLLAPHGSLSDTQIILDKGLPVDLLTGFSQVGWQAQASLPGVENLSGAVHWSPDSSRLALDSEDLTLTNGIKAPVTLSVVNTSVDFKKMGQGTHLAMDHLVIKNPDLLLTARVSLDDLTHDSVGQMDISAQVSAKNAGKWLAWIPSGHLKPKLEAWLKQDVKSIDNLSAEIRAKGLGQDFPFDKAAGEFWIKAWAQGVDLIFAPGWPMAQGIESWVRVDKRQFEASISHANLQGTVLTNGNIRITDLGLNHETLLFHSKIKTKTQYALAYILSSPLAKKLSALAMIQMKGPLELDLKLEAPLYPENDDVLALGDVSFENNQLSVKHALGTIPLNRLNGSLQFDQAGILDSSLNAVFMDYPVTLLIQSLRNAKPATQVKIKGRVAIDTLRKQLNLPFLDLVRGDFWLSALLTLTDEPNDLDRVTVNSSLKEVAIDLPPPFGKQAGKAAPLKVDVDFNPEKAMRIRVDYDDRMNGDLWFTAPKGQLQLQKGEIRLGSENALRQQQDGLQIVGELAQFDLQQWLAVAARLSGGTDGLSLKNSVHFIGLILRQARIGGQTYRDMAIKASQIKDNLWAIEVNQALVKGVFRYDLDNHSVNGSFERLHLVRQETKPGGRDQKAALSSLMPEDMPALDLSVQSLQYNDLTLGRAQVKMSRLPHVWRLDSCKITTPYYQLSASGQWTRDQAINETKLDAGLTINHLAKSLEQLKISPVVEAETGSIQLQGSWPGAFQDFALASLSGQTQILFKNGRITSLSPETEEKLGLGKLLSILSLQTIPRRLKLDFSDLSHKGYSFDQFKGSFSIAKGLMSTSDSFIDGPIAYASMKGSLDIARQLYDLNLHISPHVTASLPIVATIAGGPIAGVATWIASKIINQGMQKVSGYTYRVTGPWRQPVVEQVSIIQKKNK
ncbi:YhdP family protein [Legionella sp. CNM-4043-24]|uniref:YhdP family protein n=1 Tax=Legionella sp. CNM-4043-24 TaxID=3421646 RepID=UPI00403A8621